jgi:beta-phosphoglucomutase family hydrolase
MRQWVQTTPDRLCDGAIFDLDGVITQTAKVHFKAWKRTFDDYLRRRFGEENGFRPFTYQQDYLPYVDGKPRYQGVKSFLESRDINLPYGDPTDPAGAETVCGIGNRKNSLFRELVALEGAEVYQSTLAFVEQLRQRKIRVAVASSSMNCRFILEKTGLLERFDAVVGGTLSRELALAGKPAPDIFLVAAEKLRLHPSRCMMVEDAVSGVEAGRRGNFALVIGVARGGDGEALRSRGADLVVRDLRELSFEKIHRWFARGLAQDSWTLSYSGFEPREERLRETLTTVGNGYFGTRGAFEGNRADEVVHYPGTYIAGVYNRLPSVVYRRTVTNNDMVNCPNWLPIELKLPGGRFRSPLEAELLRYRHTLNMREAVVSRCFAFRDRKGRETAVESRRIASMEDPHLGAIRYAIRPQNWSGTVVVRSSLDGTVTNYGVPRYRELNSRHLVPIGAWEEEGETVLQVQTVTSHIKIYLRARVRLAVDGKPLEAARSVEQGAGIVSELLSFPVEAGREYAVEKVVSLYTSRDRDVTDPLEASQRSLARAGGFEELLERHRRAWRSLWQKADVVVEGDRQAQQLLRLHVYHLLCTASPHNRHLDAGLPARGLTGEAYRGHIFWDELFAYPFYNLHFPSISRSLLLYRYRRLEGAQEYAREHGYRGAMYPWQTADTGGEETQVIHFNPVSGKWDPDLSSRQRHVSIAVAYAVWEYFYCTGDLEFLHHYGAEILVQTTRFWASIAELDPADGRYRIRGVMGPDEFHEKYPDAQEGGLDDNAYTNIMASWLMHKTIETLEYLPRHEMSILQEKTGFRREEFERWKEIVRRLKVLISPDGIISQFDRYMELEELDWEAYRRRYGDIHRLDRILKAEGDSPDRYKLSKQADLLMCYYLLSPGQVKHILELMGYSVGEELQLMHRNYEYYQRRTTHGSTLSFIVHSGILKYLGRHRNDMWRWFQTALRSDAEDIQGGTTPEGIHVGVMGGTLDVLTKSFAGISLYKDAVEIEPSLPAHWRRLAFRITHRRNWLQVEITPQQIRVRKLAESRKNPVDIISAGKRYPLRERESAYIPLGNNRRHRRPNTRGQT